MSKERTEIADTFKRKLGNRILKLNFDNEKEVPIDIKEDTLNKYIRGDRFPTIENLIKIKEYYNVPYSYLFGEIDNTNSDTTKLSCELGISEDTISRLQEIVKSDNETEKKIQLFVINQLFTKIDFLSLGKALMVPNEQNKYISSNKLYDYYLDYATNCSGSDGRYRSSLYSNDKKSDYDDYVISKSLFKLFDDIRNSQECAELFIDYVDTERILVNKAYSDPSFYSQPHEQTQEELAYEYEEMNKVMEDDIRKTEKRNQDIINKRKKDLGV